MDQETETSANIQSDLPRGREGMQYEPRDAERHIKHEGMTPAQGVTTWRTMGVSNDRALRLRDEQEGAGTWAGLQSGKVVRTGRRG